jgi:hypothetical protein
MQKFAQSGHPDGESFVVQSRMAISRVDSLILRARAKVATALSRMRSVENLSFAKTLKLFWSAEASS